MASQLYKATISFDVVVASEFIPSKQQILNELKNIIQNEPSSVYNINVDRINEMHELPTNWQLNCVPYLTIDYKPISTYFEG